MQNPQPENISLADFLVWEQQQTERYEWIDGEIVPSGGVTFEHGAIAMNVSAIFHAAVGAGPCFVMPSDRQLVPQDAHGQDLGSFFADVFVSCAGSDQTGTAAHFPTVVVEILSRTVGEEFSDKKRAYLASAKLLDYLIIDSRKRYVYRYSWKTTAENARRLVTCEQWRGPVVVPALALTLTFQQIYAGTKVPAILYPITAVEEDETEIHLD